MKQMSDRYFLDSNIVVYAHTNLDLIKQGIAQRLLSNEFAYIGTQVIQETINVLSKKMKQEWSDIEMVMLELFKNNPVCVNDEKIIVKASKIAQEYKFSFYDSLVISSALECKCSVLYSEDMNSGQVIEGTLTILDPFK